MARRRMPTPPDTLDQQRAFEALTKERGFSTVVTEDPDLGGTILAAEMYEGAAQEADRRGVQRTRGRPPQWKRHAAAARILAAAGVHLSDARAARAVAKLREFLARERGGKPVPKDTAAEVAGLLLAIGRSFRQ